MPAKCIACAFYAALDNLPAGADVAGVCYGNPPRLMLLPGQAEIAGRIAKPGQGGGVSMQLIPMRPSVRGDDRACSLFQPVMKH